MPRKKLTRKRKTKKAKVVAAPTKNKGKATEKTFRHRVGEL
jgi:hypothetical protein